MLPSFKSYQLPMLMLLVACVFVSSANASNPILFGTQSEASTDLTSFPKWTGVLKREPASRTIHCSDGGCLDQTWQQISQSIPLREQSTASLKRVNDRFNQTPYLTDMINWGKNDFWATPIQFLIRNGDCEDYAIAKYMALRQQGWPADAMRIVILQDQNLRVLHAVLAVTLNNQTYILDNQIRQLLTDKQIYHYQPIYSVNERAWWRHNS